MGFDGFDAIGGGPIGAAAIGGFGTEEPLVLAGLRASLDLTNGGVFVGGGPPSPIRTMGPLFVRPRPPPPLLPLLAPTDVC